MKFQLNIFSDRTKLAFNRIMIDLSVFYIGWIAIDVLIRIYEFASLHISYFAERADYKEIFYVIMMSQPLRVVYFFMFIAPFVIMASFFSPKKKKTISWIIAGIYVFLQLSMIEFFRNSGIPLNESIYSYSLDEILMISKVSSTTNFYLFAGAWISILSAFIFSSPFIQKIRYQKVIFTSLMIIFAISTPLKSFFKVRVEQFEDEINFYVGEDKLWYFLEKSYRYCTDKIWESQPSFQELVPYIKKYQSFDTSRSYLNPIYPLLFKSDNKDVLGEFFTFTNEKPNVVFIIVEGLGKDFQGDDAFIGSFTPFLDSLSVHSLYWPNFLSTATRTFGVLPSSLGSLPYGDIGFQLIKDQYPKHHSLISILVNSGYTANYFYGGWNGFERTNKFLKTNGVTHFIPQFGSQYTKLGTASDSWGYDDKSVFGRSIEMIDSLNEEKPRLDIYMTLNVHNPWRLNDGGKYSRLVAERIDQLDKLKRLRKDSVINQEICATILSTDDAIRSYFSRIKQYKSYNNTIFLIFGDHHLGYLKKESELSAYNIPLIIYSPLLKKPQRFNSVSSQLDITPSILALLDNKFDIAVPKEAHWLGTGLDTAIEFRNIHSIPMMNPGKTVNVLLCGKYYLSDTVLYNLNQDMTLSPSCNNSVRDIFLERIRCFAKINKYVCSEDKLLP